MNIDKAHVQIYGGLASLEGAGACLLKLPLGRQRLRSLAPGNALKLYVHFLRAKGLLLLLLSVNFLEIIVFLQHLQQT